MFRHFPFPTVVVLLLALPRSAQIFVPADQPTLQDAIDASPSGGTIVVTTAFPQDPVTIDRPINIIGDPVVNIGQRGSSCSGTHEPAVTLAGPGTGIVRLSTAVLTEASDCTPMYPLLTGGGFDALHIFDSTAIEPGTGFQGTGQGAPAILTSVPFSPAPGSRAAPTASTSARTATTVQSRTWPTPRSKRPAPSPASMRRSPEAGSSRCCAA